MPGTENKPAQPRCATPASVFGSRAMKHALVLAVLLCAACSDDERSGAAEPDSGAPSCVEPAAPDAAVPKPSPAEIEFSVVNPLPSGEQILFNDWNPMPNTLHAIRPDGSQEITVFRAYRIWSLGSSHDGKTLAFACGDSQQKQNYGIDLGDAIQHTWLFDIASQSASVFAWGNLNDECHEFTRSGDALWVCRRWNFSDQGTFEGYQLARLSLPCGELSLPTSPADNQLELSPRPTPDESALYFTIVEIAAGKQTRRIVRQALPAGEPELVRESATLMALSPDGTRLLFSDHSQAGALFVSGLDGSELVKVASDGGTNAVWSPDGSRIAYLWSETQICSHVQIVLADGSQADAPERVRDCGNAFITELAWLSVP
jgi:hypothetical protein